MMNKKSVVTKRNSFIFGGVLLVVLCVTGVIIQQYVSSSQRVVLKDELQIHRKLLHNAEGDHACDCWIPKITGFKISSRTATSVSVTWDCSAPSTYQVKYGLTATKDKYFPATTPTASYTNYTVTVTGLTPNTTYHFGPSSICKKNCGNNIVYADGMFRRREDVNGKSDYTFTTPTETAVLSENKIATHTAIAEATVAKITAKDVTFRWKTNNPATSLVEYGTTTAYGSKSDENTVLERDHVIQLFDLQFGTTYHARAVSKDASGTAVSSSDFTFTTPKSEDRIVYQPSIINEPNPCSNKTVFVYSLYQPATKMTIDILTLSGKTVATLECPQSCLQEGENKVLWDVRDNAQKRLPNGLYAYTMRIQTANNEIVVTKSNLMVRR